jgi:hypothetical protein
VNNRVVALASSVLLDVKATLLPRTLIDSVERLATGTPVDQPVSLSNHKPIVFLPFVEEDEGEAPDEVTVTIAELAFCGATVKVASFVAANTTPYKAAGSDCRMELLTDEDVADPVRSITASMDPEASAECAVNWRVDGENDLLVGKLTAVRRELGPDMTTANDWELLALSVEVEGDATWVRVLETNDDNTLVGTLMVTLDDSIDRKVVEVAIVNKVEVPVDPTETVLVVNMAVASEVSVLALPTDEVLVPLWIISPVHTGKGPGYLPKL